MVAPPWLKKYVFNNFSETYLFQQCNEGDRVLYIFICMSNFWKLIEMSKVCYETKKLRETHGKG